MKPNTLTILFLLVLLSGILKAQIVYTDIKNVTFTCNKKCTKCYNYSLSKTYPLDLNNDGAPDFIITAYRAVTHYDGCSCDYCHCLDDIRNSVSIKALNNNDVLVDTSGTALISGSKIGSHSEWSTGEFDNFSLTSAYVGCYDITGGCVILRQGFWPYIDWPNSTDRYLGFNIISNGQAYYGWARLSVFVDEGEASFTVKDYAYESTPGRAIHAGDIGAALANVSNASALKNAVSLNIKIFPNPTSANTTVAFSLFKPQQVSIVLYDKDGRFVKNLGDQEFMQGIQQINVDTKDLNAGIYFLQLKTAEFVQTEKIIVTK